MLRLIGWAIVLPVLLVIYLVSFAVKVLCSEI